jgi:hypothetical protein
MSQLTPHFADTEPGLTVLAGADSHVIENVTFLCEKVLEPIHDKFGAVHVHDSYRDPGHNAQVGGKTASFHLCIGGHAAADIDVPAATFPQLFDWLRLESKLQFDKVILETRLPLPSTNPAELLEWVKKPGVCACVHIQIDRLNPSRRQAFIGQTGAATVYIQVEVK